MNRRKFVTASTISLLASSFYPISTCLAQSQPITLKGNFGIKMKGSFANPELTIDARDVIIDGLSIPKFTWSWIGLGLAEGVLNVIGGAIISAILKAIFGGGKSMEQLLNEQLDKFARIVEEAIDRNALREYKAQVSAFIVLFQEYSNDPTKSRIDYLVNESAVKLSEIESLGFIGYRTYMTCAGLRLSILQEVYRRRKTAGAKQNFDQQIDRSINHHKAMIKYIEDQTEPTIRYKEGYELLKKQPHVELYKNDLPITGKILGEKVEGRLAIRDNRILTLEEIANLKRAIAEINKKMPFKFKDEYVDFYAIRAKLKSENTDLGEKIVSRWQGKI